VYVYVDVCVYVCVYVCVCICVCVLPEYVPISEGPLGFTVYL